MAFLGQTFNADDLPQGNTYEPLPAGWYTATIADAELKTTKDGSGQYIKVRYDITGPTHQGRVVFGNINTKASRPRKSAASSSASSCARSDWPGSRTPTN
jgi:hypothetical protein